MKTSQSLAVPARLLEDLRLAPGAGPSNADESVLGRGRVWLVLVSPSSRQPLPKVRKLSLWLDLPIVPLLGVVDDLGRGGGVLSLSFFFTEGLYLLWKKLFALARRFLDDERRQLLGSVLEPCEYTCTFFPSRYCMQLALRYPCPHANALVGVM